MYTYSIQIQHTRTAYGTAYSFSRSALTVLWFDSRSLHMMRLIGPVFWLHEFGDLSREETLQMTENWSLLDRHAFARLCQAYGFGIEQDYLAKLLPKRQFYQGDDLGEGVCQSLSVLNQLQLGLRHVEIDINSGYYTGNLTRLDEIHVCHSPVPLDVALVAEVDVALDRAGVVDGWHAENLSCEATNVPFRTMLLEVKGWLDAH